MVDSSDDKPPEPPGFEIPDLDLGAPPRTTARSAPAQKGDPFGSLEPADTALPAGLDIQELPEIPVAGGAAPSGGLDYFGAGTFDADDFDDALQYGSGALDLAEVPTGGVANAAPETERWPSGCSPERGAIAIDRAEARALRRLRPGTEGTVPNARPTRFVCCRVAGRCERIWPARRPLWSAPNARATACWAPSSKPWRRPSKPTNACVPCSNP